MRLAAHTDPAQPGSARPEQAPSQVAPPVVKIAAEAGVLRPSKTGQIHADALIPGRKELARMTHAELWELLRSPQATLSEPLRALGQRAAQQAEGQALSPGEQLRAHIWQQRRHRQITLSAAGGRFGVKSPDLSIQLSVESAGRIMQAPAGDRWLEDCALSALAAASAESTGITPGSELSTRFLNWTLLHVVWPVLLCVVMLSDTLRASLPTVLLCAAVWTEHMIRTIRTGGFDQPLGLVRAPDVRRVKRSYQLSAAVSTTVMSGVIAQTAATSAGMGAANSLELATFYGGLFLSVLTLCLLTGRRPLQNRSAEAGMRQALLEAQKIGDESGASEGGRPEVRPERSGAENRELGTRRLRALA